MSWESSERRSQLPTDWPRLRRQVLVEAGYRCENIQKSGKRCWDKATDVDHIVNAASGGTDHRSNLRALCAFCHRIKSSREGVEARRAADAVLKRAPEQPPGLVDPANPLPPPKYKGF